MFIEHHTAVEASSGVMTSEGCVFHTQALSGRMFSLRQVVTGSQPLVVLEHCQLMWIVHW